MLLKDPKNIQKQESNRTLCEGSIDSTASSEFGEVSEDGEKLEIVGTTEFPNSFSHDKKSPLCSLKYCVPQFMDLLTFVDRSCGWVENKLVSWIVCFPKLHHSRGRDEIV